ncbi:MAG: hypothetical protein GY927_18045, partial [bacterium]|nr:hypothetical protein [bacterium]
PECQAAFEALKAELISSSVMAYPDMTRPFYLETDASMKGLGVILSQKDRNYKNHLRPILSGSRVLKDAETRYCASELEALAIVWALKRHNAILWNQTVYVITDHEALKKLMAVKEPATPKLARYVELMSTYGITNNRILYRPGLKNQAPDALSRYALPLDPNETGMDLENDSSVHLLQFASDINVVSPIAKDSSPFQDQFLRLETWQDCRMLQKQKWRRMCANKRRHRKNLHKQRSLALRLCQPRHPPWFALT